MHLHRPVAAALRRLLVAAPAVAAAVVLTAAPARADPTAAPPEHARTRHPAPADVGQLRDATLTAPAAGTVQADGTRPSERDVAPIARARGPLSSADAMAELAARQLRTQTRRQQRAVGACTAAAVRRHPAAAGTVRLAFDVHESKIGEVHVTDDTLRDPALDACLTTVAKRFHFSLETAHITWPVDVSPSAAR